MREKRSAGRRRARDGPARRAVPNASILAVHVHGRRPRPRPPRGRAVARLGRAGPAPPAERMRDGRCRRNHRREDLPDGPWRRAIGGARGSRCGRACGWRRRLPQPRADARPRRRRGRRGGRARPIEGIARRRRDCAPGPGRPGLRGRRAPRRRHPRGRPRRVHLPIHLRRGRTRRIRRRRWHRAVPRRQPPSTSQSRHGQAVQRLQVRHDHRRKDRDNLGAQRVGHGSRGEAAGLGGARAVRRRRRGRHHRPQR